MSPEARERSFDDLARALAEGSISRRRALKLFAGTAIAALIPSRALAQQQKVTICHKPGTPDEETKEVSQSAVASHMRHGDTLGPCVACPSGTTLCGDSCCTADENCWSDGDIGLFAICCSKDPFCAGVRTVAGQDVCVDNAAYFDCGARPTCNTDAECSSGEVCVPTFCDPQNRCVPAC
jgi:hypothetical protein